MTDDLKSTPGAHPPPRVAVLGAGVAGLSCAVQLHSRGVRTEIFDQGSRGPGGRSSSSRPATVSGAGDDSEPLVFDHGCQFFTATHPAFKVSDEARREERVRSFARIVYTVVVGVCDCRVCNR